MKTSIETMSGSQQRRARRWQVPGVGLRVVLAFGLLSLASTVAAPTDVAAVQPHGGHVWRVVNWSAGPETADAIAVGTRHAVGSVSGRLVGWGDDRDGALDMNSEGAVQGVTHVAASSKNSFAVVNGSVRGWGEGTYGQLDIPKAARSGVTALAVGRVHGLAVRKGRVIQWGNQHPGGDFNHDFGQTKMPSGLSSVTAVAAGPYHSVALASGGRVVAWGGRGSRGGANYDYGQADVPSEAESEVTAIAASLTNTLAVRRGAVLAWGRGGGAGADPVPASARSGVTAIAAGTTYALAVSNGRVVAWQHGQDREATGFVPPGLGRGVTAVVAYSDTYGALVGNKVVVWNADGVLGPGRVGAARGTAIDVGATASARVIAGEAQIFGEAADVAGDGEVIDVSISTHTIALTTQGIIAAGANSQGQTDIPSSVRDGRGVTQVAAGRGFSVALDAGRVVTWGRGIGTTVPSVLQSGVTAIEAGSDYVLAIKAGEVYAFGQGGRLRRVPALSGVTSIAAGDRFALAVANGGVRAWNPKTGATVGVPSGLDSDVAAVAAGRAHGLALINGRVRAWGDNSRKQAPSTIRPEVNVTDPDVSGGVTEIAAGGDTSLALRNGGVVGWGDDTSGQISNLPPLRRPQLAAAVDERRITFNWDVNQVVGGRRWTATISGGGDQCNRTLTPGSPQIDSCVRDLAYDQYLDVTIRVVAPGGLYTYVPSYSKTVRGRAVPMPVTTPGAPVLTDVQAGDRTMTLRAQIPVGSDGGCAQRPIVQYRLDAAGVTLDRDWQSSNVFENLQNGIAYTASVRQTIEGLDCIRGLPQGQSAVSPPSNTIVDTPYGEFADPTVTVRSYGLAVVWTWNTNQTNGSGLKWTASVTGCTGQSPSTVETTWESGASQVVRCVARLGSYNRTSARTLKLTAVGLGGRTLTKTWRVEGTSGASRIVPPGVPTISKIQSSDRTLAVIATRGSTGGCAETYLEYSLTGVEGTFSRGSRFTGLDNGTPQTIFVRSSFAGTDCVLGDVPAPVAVSSSVSATATPLGPLNKPTMKVKVKGSKITWTWDANQGDNGRAWVATIRGEGKTFTIRPGQRQTGSWTKDFGNSSKLRTMTITVRANGIEKKASKSARPQ